MLMESKLLKNFIFPLSSIDWNELLNILLSSNTPRERNQIGIKLGTKHFMYQKLEKFT